MIQGTLKILIYVGFLFVYAGYTFGQNTPEQANQQFTQNMNIQVQDKKGNLVSESYQIDPTALNNLREQSRAAIEDAQVLRGQSSPYDGTAFWTPLSSDKDVAKKNIRFLIADSNNPDKYLDLDFQYDPRMLDVISEKRQELIAMREEQANRKKFYKQFLNLDENYPDNLYHTHLLTMDKDVAREMDAAYQTQAAGRYTHTDEAFRNYLKVVLQLPETTTGEEAQKQFLGQPTERRNEILKLYELKNKKLSELAKISIKTTLSRSQHGFATQTALFMIAQGGIIFWNCEKQRAYNPQCAEQILNGYKDPIGQAAFAAFIFANKFATDLLEKHYGGVATQRAAFMRAAAPYLGMFAGILVSNLTAEVLTLMNTCAKSLMGGQEAQAQMAQMGAGQEDPCDIAQKEFYNFENKIEQYVPMVISMGASTYMLVKGMKIAQGAMVYSTGIAQGVAQTSVAQRISGTAMMQALKAKSAPAFRVTGAILKYTPGPKAWLFSGMSVAMFTFQVAQNYGFLGLDHVFIPFLSKSWGQVWRSYLNDSAEKDLKNVFELNQKSEWKAAVNYQMNTANGKSRYYNPTGSPALAIKDFSTQMAAWRMANHSKFFVGFQSWSDRASQMIREISVNEMFYSFYVGKIFDFHKFKMKADTPEGLDGDEAHLEYTAAFKRYPLYGVRPTSSRICPTEKNEIWCTTMVDMYLEHPDVMEKYQKITIREAVTWVENEFQATTYRIKLYVPDEKNPSEMTTKLMVIKKSDIEPAHITLISEILKSLKAHDTDSLGKALDKLNLNIQILSRDEEAQNILKHLRSLIGNPRPAWGNGSLLPTLFKIKTAELKVLEDLKVPDSAYRTENYLDHMIYSMLCGPDSLDFDKVAADGLLAPKFRSPRLVKNSEILIQLPSHTKKRMSSGKTLNSLCDPGTFNTNPLKFRDLQESLIYDSKDSQGLPLYAYLARNIRPEILGDWTNTNRNSHSNFLNWWNSTAKKAMVALFTRFDNEFQKLLVGFTDALNNESFSDAADWYDWVSKKLGGPSRYEVDPAGLFKWGHARRALTKTHIQEMNVYLTFLAEVENSVDTENYKKKKIALDSNKTFLEEMLMPVYARIQSQKEMVERLKYVVNAVEGLKLVKGKATLPITIKAFNAGHDALLEQLVQYKTHLNKLKLNTLQKEAMTSAYEALEKSCLELSVYVFYTELTNFSMTQNYHEYLANTKRIKEANKDQKLLKQKSSLTGQ